MPQASYCYVRVVGRGSYGEVTLVRHRRDGRQYVIKKLNLRNASSRERRAAEQEAQLLSQLKHPNIVTYKESWEGGDGLLYIVMGFCEGGDLYRKLKEQKGQLLPESRVVEWFVQIAMALQYLHEKHILHRDLKTQNVFLTRTNIIKVGDLGIARVLEHQSDMASTLIGTPYYMSPELFSNQPYNYKSDVWALGCCVYEMATLKHAFNAKDMNSLVYRIIEGKLPPMPKVYSPELAELIRTMLSRRPEERPSVRSILRQPYIKHQISLFLEATKAKTCKNNVKNGDSRAKPVAAVVSREEASSHEVIHDQPCPSEGSTARDTGEDKCLSQEKPVAVGPWKSPANLKGHTGKPDMNNTAGSFATISRINIDILPVERRDSANNGIVRENQPRHSDASNEVDSQYRISQDKERLQGNNKSNEQPENLLPKWSSDYGDGEGNEPVKPLQPPNKDQKPGQDQVTSGYRIEKQDSIPRFQPHSCVSEPSVSRQRRQKRREQTDRGQAKSQFQESPPRLLPSHPDDGKVDIISTQQNDENQSRPVAGSVNSSRINSVSSSKDRPLSARERRRLKQSQEEMLPSGPSVRRTSSAVEPVKPREEGQPTPARRFSSDCSVPQEKRQSHGLSEDDELSSSTSSTEKSDGDSREGKSQTNEMSDLVQLMTQTLKLDSRESCEDLRVLNPVSEFRLHRKYRDTLVLHGKAAEEVELHGQALPPAVIPGSEKIRRIVEVLRADVIQGLGVQLLEQVYDLLEAEEDESEREVWMFYLHVCRPDGLRGWKTALDPLELELQMAVCWLGVEHRLSGKAALNYCTIFTALSKCCWINIFRFQKIF
ncbi:serine/threonine-protein kinase Nek4 isoform X3 [Mesocricetus auratus]|uniref:non-specific serine/threonine protein kinase n=1 Tax=Mesocricetus auratus TaxID=10036 RepID=A0ABM2XM06_MESAU|nr:serine/threonine-protein kinase Nek4 isoform X3 [Mesocricetus auratus]